jgi:DNA-binding PadR family transcriptional regulator
MQDMRLSTITGPEQTTLSSTEASILGLLLFGERSGHDLHRLVERSVGFFWKPARSQIYALLPRLVERGFATRRAVVQSQRPDKQLYRLAPEGYAALRDWMERPPERVAAKSPFQLKLFFGALARPGRMLAQVDETRRRALEHIARLEAIERDILADDDAEEDFFPYLTLKLGLAYERAFVGWADEALRAIAARGAAGK